MGCLGKQVTYMQSTFLHDLKAFLLERGEQAGWKMEPTPIVSIRWTHSGHI